MTFQSEDIDLAARAMVDEPASDLEARIKSRLDAGTIRTQPRWRPAYWLGAAGLTATAVILALVVQGPTRSTVQGSPEEPVVQGPTGSTVQGSDEVPKSRGPVAEPRNQRANRGPWTLSNPGPQVRPSEAELAWMSRRISPLDVIDPLQVERLQFESIQPDAISITPLTITPLVTSPVAGEPDTERRQ